MKEKTMREENLSKFKDMLSHPIFGDGCHSVGKKTSPVFTSSLVKKEN